MVISSLLISPLSRLSSLKVQKHQKQDDIYSAFNWWLNGLMLLMLEYKYYYAVKPPNKEVDNGYHHEWRFLNNQHHNVPWII